MPNQRGSGYWPEPVGILHTLQFLALLNIGTRAIQPGLFVIPQGETDRYFRFHIRSIEDTRQFHHQRRTGTVVVDCLVNTVPIHMGTDDIHLIGS